MTVQTVDQIPVPTVGTGLRKQIKSRFDPSENPKLPLHCAIFHHHAPSSLLLYENPLLVAVKQSATANGPFFSLSLSLSQLSLSSAAMSISGGSPSTTVLPPSSSSLLKRKRPPSIEIPDVLREVRPDELRFRESTPKKSDAVSVGSSGVGIFSVKGKKKLMEDTHRIIPSFFGKPNRVTT